jgi:hypothetical protein
MNLSNAASASSSCLICSAWCKTTCERAFTLGLHIPAADAHETLVLGFVLALYSATRGERPELCGVHAQQAEGWVAAFKRNNGDMMRTVQELSHAGKSAIGVGDRGPRS